MVGIAMIIYALWLIRAWQREMGKLPFDSGSPAPWFIYASLGIGIFLCVITCSGHIAAETGNGHCLSCYMVFVFLLLVLEAAVAADVFLNHDWEKDFPDDPSGEFDDFKNFVKSNFEFCKWIGLLIVATQGVSILLSMILRALGSDQVRDYDSDDDFAVARLPLLRNQAQVPACVVGEPHFIPKSDSWNVRIHDKTNK
ncbi:hypothetical protein Syun_008399 [Stephania yunnanensis]|uniref:Tetraspanin n=1 Tax=Stephania yunnanensis TaxID=152371 RepID=A0AAP0KF72_9MAGN